MTPMNIMGADLLVLVLIALILLLFTGGARLAGLGQGAGRAIREFREETRLGKDGKRTHPAQTDEAPTKPE